MNILQEIESTVYAMISARATFKKDLLQKKREDIHPMDIALTSRILNNKRDPSKNLYLLTPSAAEDFASSLKFNSVYEFIWGNEKERDSYFGYLFSKGVEYLLTTKRKSAIQKSLFAYSPFARQTALQEVQKDGSLDIFMTIPAGYIDYYIEAVVDEDKTPTAIAYLYSELKDIFTQKHYKFFKNKYTTKLGQRIKAFYDVDLYNLISNVTSSDGYTVYSLTKRIITSVADQEMKYSAAEDDDSILAFQEGEYSGALEDLAKKGMSYVDTLVDVQQYMPKIMQNSPYAGICHNHWSSSRLPDYYKLTNI